MNFFKKNNNISEITPATIERDTRNIGLEEINAIALSAKHLQEQSLNSNQQQK